MTVAGSSLAHVWGGEKACGLAEDLELLVAGVTGCQESSIPVATEDEVTGVLVGLHNGTDLV